MFQNDQSDETSKGKKKKKNLPPYNVGLAAVVV